MGDKLRHLFGTVLAWLLLGIFVVFSLCIFIVGMTWLLKLLGVA